MTTFKNPWGDGGINFPNHIGDTIERWFENGGTSTENGLQSQDIPVCTIPLSNMAVELYVSKIEEKFAGKPIDQGTVTLLYDELKTYIGSSFTTPDRKCCGTLLRFFILPYINGEMQDNVVYPEENVEGILGIAANGKIEDNNDNSITFVFGIDECHV